MMTNTSSIVLQVEPTRLSYVPHRVQLSGCMKEYSDNFLVELVEEVAESEIVRPSVKRIETIFLSNEEILDSA